MKKTIYLLGVIAIIASSCNTTEVITRNVAYKGIYDQKPLAVLLMPPINKSTNVEAKEYFHSTLNVPLANAGYYVIPPFLSMEILKKESAYDSELFLNGSLNKFGEVFGADVALFTIINKWDKSALASKIYVEVEYILKSISTNEIIYQRKGNITYDTSIASSGGGLAGALVSMAASAINTAATNYMVVARAANSYTFKDIPSGKYSPNYGTDGDLPAGLKDFSVRLNSNYK